MAKIRDWLWALRRALRKSPADPAGGEFSPAANETGPGRQAQSEKWEPLPQAARRVLGGNMDNLIGEMALSEPSPEDTLNFMGTWIVQTKRIPLYGRRPPSQLYARIPVEDVQRLVLKGGAKELWQFQARRPTYVDLAVAQGAIDDNWDALCSEEP